jgi:hypothetical protein
MYKICFKSSVEFQVCCIVNINKIVKNDYAMICHKEFFCLESAKLYAEKEYDYDILEVIE